MEETILASPNNDGRIMKLEIKQKNAYIRKRKVKTWTPDEDQKLVKLYQQYPKKWGVIASLMYDRNQNQCLHRYRRLSQLGAHKKIWSADQDQAILTLIKKVGKNWKLLSQMIGTKTGKQIRQRFINKLDPKIKTEEWTDQQDRLILTYYSEVGSRWSQISKRLPGRPQNKIKNRFYSYIQKNYDIKYTLIEPSQYNVMQEQKKQRKQLKQLSPNESYGESQNKHRCSSGKQNNGSNKQIPSIKQFDDDFKVHDGQCEHGQCEHGQCEHRQCEHGQCEHGQCEQEKDEIFDSNIHLSNKFYLKSLIRVDDELGNMECKYRSIRDIVSNNEIEHENDLFYLSQ